MFIMCFGKKMSNVLEIKERQKSCTVCVRCTKLFKDNSLGVSCVYTEKFTRQSTIIITKIYIGRLVGYGRFIVHTEYLRWRGAGDKSAWCKRNGSRAQKLETTRNVQAALLYAGAVRHGTSLLQDNERMGHLGQDNLVTAGKLLPDMTPRQRWHIWSAVGG